MACLPGKVMTTPRPTTYRLSPVAIDQIKATPTDRLRVRLAGLRLATKSDQVVRAFIEIISAELATR